MKYIFYINWWLYMLYWNIIYFRTGEGVKEYIILMWFSLGIYAILDKLDKKGE